MARLQALSPTADLGELRERGAWLLWCLVRVVGLGSASWAAVRLHIMLVSEQGRLHTVAGNAAVKVRLLDSVTALALPGL